MKNILFNNEKKISRIAIFAVFLGLIRSLSEPFRLHYYSSFPLSFDQVKPFLVGSLVASTGLLLMVILSFYNRHRIITMVAIVTILSMMVVKWSYHI